jgi:serine/threonine protein phosphatase PrpC
LSIVHFQPASQPASQISPFPLTGETRARVLVGCVQDAHCCHHPFFDESDIALFCVLDGHAGREAALTAAQLIPKARRTRHDQRPTTHLAATVGMQGMDGVSRALAD